jgi:RNA polymerase sigma-70 factor (ECF subfamily)
MPTLKPQTRLGDAAEDELVQGARRRNEAATRALIQINNRRLFRLARGILRNDAEAEDVVQETYVRAFTHLESFRGDSSFSSWLSRIAINDALGRLRRQRASPIRSGPDRSVTGDNVIVPFPQADPSADPEKAMAQREIQHVVERAVDDLPDTFRFVFMARVIEGLTVEETADLLAIKPETVKTRLHRARSLLRENVEKEIGPAFLTAFPFAGRRCASLTNAVIARLGWAE